MTTDPKITIVTIPQADRTVRYVALYRKAAAAVASDPALIDYVDPGAIADVDDDGTIVWVTTTRCRRHTTAARNAIRMAVG